MAKSKKRKELTGGIWALALCAAVLTAAGVLMWKLLPSRQPADPYGPTDFVYEGEYLTCLTGQSVLGVDVSSHQGQIDWQQVRDAGFEFVMIRTGYRGYESGQIHADELARQNYAGAKAAGLKVGAYFFSQAVSREEALEEAEFLLTAIDGWEVEMPVVFDWEYVDDSARTAHVTPETLTDCTLAFADAVEAAGYEPMLYFNPHLASDYLDLEQLEEYPFWLALYTDQLTVDYPVDMWQYTQTGSVPGITGKVDINLWLP